MAKNIALAEGFLEIKKKIQKKYAHVFGIKMKLKKTGIVFVIYT
jgi:hypothetical protein